MTLGIRRDGKLTGAITFSGDPNDEANRWSLEGEVDEFGNLTADVGANAIKDGKNWIGIAVMKLPFTGFEKTARGADTIVRMEFLRVPHLGFNFEMKCFMSKTLAEAEAVGKTPPETDPPPAAAAGRARF